MDQRVRLIAGVVGDVDSQDAAAVIGSSKAVSSFLEDSATSHLQVPKNIALFFNCFGSVVEPLLHCVWLCCNAP
jgi:hypothetical protein